MLQVRNLEVVYDDVMLVLRGLSLTVPPGGIVALLGANGAGKTTLLRAITGLLDVHDGEVTKGEVTLDGEPIHRLRPAAIVRRGVGQVMEGRRIFGELTVEENLRLGGAHRPAPGPRAGSTRCSPSSRCSRSGAREHGRLPLRRRAADAGDGPGADGRAALPAARRAQPRPGPHAGRAGPRADRPRSTRPAPRAAGRAERHHGAVHRRARLRAGDREGGAGQAGRRSCSPTTTCGSSTSACTPARRPRARSATSSTTGAGSGGCRDRPGDPALHRRPAQLRRRHRRSTGSASPSAGASCSPSSGPTAPARPRCSTCSPGSTGRSPAGSSSTASTCSAGGRTDRRARAGPDLPERRAVRQPDRPGEPAARPAPPPAVRDAGRGRLVGPGPPAGAGRPRRRRGDRRVPGAGAVAPDAGRAAAVRGAEAGGAGPGPRDGAEAAAARRAGRRA